MLIAIILLSKCIWVAKIQAQESVETPDYNSALFAETGQTAEQTGFGHMVFDLRLQDVKEVFEHVEDLFSGTVRTNPEIKKPWHDSVLYSIVRAKSKLQLLWELSTHISQNDEFDVSVVKTWEQRINEKYPPETSTTSSRTAGNGASSSNSGKKRGAALWAAGMIITNLAAFGMSLYNRKQLNQIVEAAKQTSEDTNIVAQMADKNTIRIDDVADYVNDMQEKLTLSLNRQAMLTKTSLTKSLLSRLEYLEAQFQIELNEYLTGITTLMDQRLSPFLIEPDALAQSYDKLLKLARQQNLNPLTEDSGIIFQSKVTTVVTEHHKLYAIVHIPLYQGSLMKMYRHLPAPFFLNSDVVIRIKSEFDFIALNSRGTLAKQFTAMDVQNCKEVNKIFHCPRKNILEKDLKSLCLYNLFHQDMDHIAETCEVVMDTAKNHAIQIAGNAFRIFAQQPTQLTINCNAHETQVHTIENVYLLELNKTCPKANTQTHLFVHNSMASTLSQIVRIPTVTKIESWLGDIDQALADLDVPLVVKEIQKSSPGPVTISQFREHIRNRPLSRFLMVVNYIQYSLTALATLLILIFSIRFSCITLLRFCPFRIPRIVYNVPQPYRESAPAVEKAQLMPIAQGITINDLK